MSTSTESADVQAVAAVPERIVEAWRRQDGTAFAEVFTEDGTMILPGVYQKGRGTIAAFMSHAFAGPYKDTQVMGTPFDVRFLREDVAVLLTEGGVRPAGGSEVPADAKVRATWVIVRDGEEWRLASYSNSPKS